MVRKLIENRIFSKLLRSASGQTTQTMMTRKKKQQNYLSTFALRLLNLTKFLFGAFCAVTLAVMTWSVYDSFRSEPTGTSIRTVSQEELPFPGISICDPNHDVERVFKDFK